MQADIKQAVVLVGGPLCGNIASPESPSESGRFKVRWWKEFPHRCFSLTYEIDKPSDEGGPATATFICQEEV